MVQEPTLFIDLNALAHNYGVLKQKLNADTKFLAVVKASSYGHAPGPVAQKLVDLGVDYFGVAYALEGAELRAAGIKTLPSSCWWFSKIATSQRVVAKVPFKVAAIFGLPFSSR